MTADLDRHLVVAEKRRRQQQELARFEAMLGRSVPSAKKERQPRGITAVLRARLTASEQRVRELTNRLAMYERMMRHDTEEHIPLIKELQRFKEKRLNAPTIPVDSICPGCLYLSRFPGAIFIREGHTCRRTE